MANTTKSKNMSSTHHRSSQGTTNHSRTQSASATRQGAHSTAHRARNEDGQFMSEGSRSKNTSNGTRSTRNARSSHSRSSY